MKKIFIILAIIGATINSRAQYFSSDGTFELAPNATINNRNWDITPCV